jgi:peptide deformylase
MFEIVKFPNPILRRQMPAFDFLNPIMDPKELEKRMIETMLKNYGLGLSANQCNIETSVFVMGHPEMPENATAFFNPKIVANTKDIKDLDEGCLSFPGIYVNIKRPTAIKAQWQDSDGNLCEGEFSGYECKCFLHEHDHLQGIVFSDRVSQLKCAMAIKKFKSQKRKHNS